MAQKVQVVLTCDLDDAETPAVDTVTFSFDGETYEFELCDAHLDEFRKVMSGYTAAARAVGGGRRRAPGRRPVARGARRVSQPTDDIRQWARAEGFTVSDRGRIPAHIREAYEARS